MDSDGEDFRRWRAGAPEPTWGRKQPWLDFLREEAAAGKTRTRVRIFSERLTDYERYVCEWASASWHARSATQSDRHVAG